MSDLDRAVAHAKAIAARFTDDPTIRISSKGSFGGTVNIVAHFTHNGVEHKLTGTVWADNPEGGQWHLYRREPVLERLLTLSSSSSVDEVEKIMRSPLSEDVPA